MLNINPVKFEQIVEAAKAKAANDRRWVRAIERAAEQIATNPYMTYRDGELLVLGTTGRTYRANGTCQCEAYAQGVACWHRAACKLLKRYFEAESKAEAFRRAMAGIKRRGKALYIEGFAI